MTDTPAPRPHGAELPRLWQLTVRLTEQPASPARIVALFQQATDLLQASRYEGPLSSSLDSEPAPGWLPVVRFAHPDREPVAALVRWVLDFWPPATLTFTHVPSPRS